MKAQTVVNKLLEADEFDPKSYLMALERKRDIVQRLVKKYAVRHSWQDPNRLLITFPKDVRFGIALHNHGVSPASSIGISGGSKNYRMMYLWADGDLDSLVRPPPPTPDCNYPPPA